jgi:hypothetical protein
VSLRRLLTHPGLNASSSDPAVNATTAWCWGAVSHTAESRHVQLENWIRRAATVSTARDLFSDEPE